jgi:homoserine dehydrogenase
VDFENNAISIESTYAGTLTLAGRGAGAEPTGSAVLANVVELAQWLEAKWTRQAEEV